MPKKLLPRILSVSVGEKPFTLRINWSHGGENIVDISGLIKKFRIYAPIRESLERFAQVHVGEHGTDIVWSDELDMAANTLWRLAQEQSGVTMTANAFRDWRIRQSYTLDEAAKALGLSRRMVAYYDQGEKPIPRIVALATRALEQNSGNNNQQSVQGG